MAASVNRVVCEKRLLRFTWWRNALFAGWSTHDSSAGRWSFSSDSSSSDSDDDEKEAKKKKPTVQNRRTSVKLASILSDLKLETSILPEKSLLTLKLARPFGRRKSTVDVKPKDERYKEIDPDLTKAVKDVAESLGGDINHTESELLLRLRSHAIETKEMINDNENNSVKNISDVFVGIKIDKTKSRIKVNEKKNRMFEEQKDKNLFPKLETDYKRTASYSTRILRVNMYKSRRLGIFDPNNEDLTKDTPETSLWNELTEHELKLLVTHPPKNAFEEMIRWTEEGKLWKFPIDNEQGLKEEKKVGFHEHVFLEYLLDDFPKKGPIRHFMELVIVGLSKNPYVTIERKKEHVEWYRKYFKEKEDIICEVDASLLQ